MNITVVGNRPDKLNNEWDYIGDCTNYIYQMIEDKIRLCEKPYGMCGLSPGAGMISGMVFSNLNIPFTVIIPYEGVTQGWPDYAVGMYEFIIRNAKVVSYIKKGPYEQFKVRARDYFNIAHSDKVIFVWDGTYGYTQDMINYAEKEKKPCYFINPRNFKNPHTYETNTKPTPNQASQLSITSIC